MAIIWILTVWNRVSVQLTNNRVSPWARQTYGSLKLHRSSNYCIRESMCFQPIIRSLEEENIASYLDVITWTLHYFDIGLKRYKLTSCFSCLNFWDEAYWFLSLRVFGLLSSSLLLFPQRFGRYVLRPSSGVCRTREPSRNFELRPLLNPRGSPVLIPFAITGYNCSVSLYCYSPVLRIEPAS